MGSINFPAATMFGSLSDVVGTKSGLALNRQQLGDLFARDERFRTSRICAMTHGCASNE